MKHLFAGAAPGAERTGSVRTQAAALLVVVLIVVLGTRGMSLSGADAKGAVRRAVDALAPSQYSSDNNMAGFVAVLREGVEQSQPEDPIGFVISALRGVQSTKMIIAGAPASGKGTQCELLVRYFGFVHISTGDLLRSEVKNETVLGKKAQVFMEAGKLVPDELVVDMLLARMAEEDVRERGWLLDGFPRTLPQLRMLQEKELVPDHVVLLDVPDEVVVERVEGRRTDPVTGRVYHLKHRPPPADLLPRLVQRADDTRAKIEERLRQYHQNIVKVVRELTCPVHTIKGAGLTPKEIMSLIIRPIQTARWRALGRGMGLLNAEVVVGQ